MNIQRWQPYFRPIITGSLIALILLLLWQGNFFTTFQLSLTNNYYVNLPTSDTLVIVALDDQSFAAYGRAPAEWDRSIYANLVEVLADAGARVIAFDLLFTGETPEDSRLAQALAEARNSEQRTRLVLAAAGVNLPEALQKNSPYTRGIRYSSQLVPAQALADQAHYLGYVNAFPDSDSRIRRQPSLIQTVTSTELAFSLTVYMAYLRIPAQAVSQLVVEKAEHLEITPERALPVDENGFWIQNFFGPAATQSSQTFPVVSLLDVLEGRTDKRMFHDRIVLVGIMNSTGVTDQALVPASVQPMAGVEIQANAIETLLQNVPLRQQSPTIEAIVIAAFSLGSTFVYYLVGWKRKLLLMLIFVAAYVVFAFVQFSLAQTISNLFYPVLALIVPLILTIGFDITKEITLRIRTEAQMHLLEELNARTEAEKKLLEELNVKTEAEKKNLQDLNELKTRMIRMASHDLKNPLGRVFGYAELLLMDELTDEQKSFVRNIRIAGDEMNTLITEILNLEQLKSGALHMEDIAINEVVQQVATRHEPDLYRKNQTYTEDIVREPLLVHADTRQISQAITNLIGNAVKYTPEGGSVTVRVYQREDVARIEVIDTGYGMPSDALPKLFTEFYRIRTQATQNIKGTGLGLSLVKQVIDAHNGRIWVESEEGKGSTFFVEIPLVRQSEATS